MGFQALFSLIGLCLVVAALVFHGIPTGPANFEIGVMGGGFFVASAVWSIWKMVKESHR